MPSASDIDRLARALAFEWWHAWLSASRHAEPDQREVSRRARESFPYFRTRAARLLHRSQRHPQSLTNRSRMGAPS